MTVDNVLSWTALVLATLAAYVVSTEVRGISRAGVDK